ncbi:MAG TPA: hypothetical protein ENL22_08200, partial [candidate division Zixibacteria bacterium]|nr:hypothetical protein [candidate division Zixibacteria bacterium]
MKKHPSIDEQAKLAVEAIHAKFVKQVKEMHQKDNPSRSMLKQAEYFLEKIRENYQNDPECKYYLWAFIWSARAVIDYLMKYYGLTKNEWISIKELEFLYKIRNLTIHRRPLPTE